MSGGYEEDEDYGDIVVYTGEGGREPGGSRQPFADQVLKRGNLGLHRSMTLGRPVRVIRGARLDSPYAPREGYRYDGLYRVEDAWTENRQGFRIWRFRMIREDDAPLPKPKAGTAPQPPPRTETTVQRIVRDTKVSQRVKKLHHFECQICGQTLETPSGRYAEAAHIRPLGRPHDGPDTEGNILCLCPNHHVLFDSGAISLLDDLSILGQSGELRTVSRHSIDVRYVQYHRRFYAEHLDAS